MAQAAMALPLVGQGTSISVESMEVALAETTLRNALSDVRDAQRKVKRGVEGKSTLYAAEWRVERARARVRDLSDHR